MLVRGISGVWEMLTKWTIERLGEMEGGGEILFHPFLVRELLLPLFGTEVFFFLNDV